MNLDHDSSKLSDTHPRDLQSRHGVTLESHDPARGFGFLVQTVVRWCKKEQSILRCENKLVN
jgi:hypothetical protein